MKYTFWNVANRWILVFKKITIRLPHITYSVFTCPSGFFPVFLFRFPDYIVSVIIYRSVFSVSEAVSFGMIHLMLYLTSILMHPNRIALFVTKARSTNNSALFTKDRVPCDTLKYSCHVWINSCYFCRVFSLYTFSEIVMKFHRWRRSVCACDTLVL